MVVDVVEQEAEELLLLEKVVRLELALEAGVRAVPRFGFVQGFNVYILVRILGFRVQGFSPFRVSGLSSGVRGFGLRVSGVEFRV